MIKLFRNIRQNLLNEGKTSKYFKYAIGEIILVVIGILIALSINNYNEELKTDTKIKKSLIALRNDLVQNTLLVQQNLPEVNRQYELNESLRIRIAKKGATVDTLVKIARHEFNPNWNDPIVYNTNAYIGLNDSGLIENLPYSLKILIKNFYNKKLNYKGIQENIAEGYKNKVSVYVDTYTFGSTPIHDQGHLIDSLVWSNIDLANLVAKFQGMSNFKRILFSINKDEMEYSLKNSKNLIKHIDQNLKKN